MKIIFVALSSLMLMMVFSAEKIFSQTLTVSSSHVNFGNAYENAPDSLPLTIYNNMGRTIQVTGMKFYSTYGSPAFSANTNSFAIANGSSQVAWIKFFPRHNIFHNSELVIENDGLRGYVHVDLKGQGKYSMTYYDSTENLSEENLKNAIHYITGIGYDTLMYNPARDSMFMFLDNKAVNGQGASQNTLECIYTGREAVGYTSRTDCQNNFLFNTEHTWPQSLFSSAEPMKSDLHHLFPTDNTANNIRADNPFGMVTNPTWSVGGSSGTTTLFEPRDAQKGRAARALMYFVLRYQNYSNFFTPQESILRTWHHTFPPNQVERKRNDDIKRIQHNRNPFVDYPQLIERIYSISNFSVAPNIPSLDLTEDTIVYGFVQSGVSHIFHYVIVNNGTVDIHFSNISLSHPGVLSFQAGGSDTLILPGEALDIEINLFTANQNAIHDSLMFNTDVPGYTLVSIPIYANDPVINGIQQAGFNASLENTMVLFPNPVDEKIVLTATFGKISAVKMFDVLGNEINLEKYDDTPGNSITIDVARLSKGIYFLFIQSESGLIKKKFLKD